MSTKTRRYSLGGGKKPIKIFVPKVGVVNGEPSFTYKGQLLWVGNYAGKMVYVEYYEGKSKHKCGWYQIVGPMKSVLDAYFTNNIDMPLSEYLWRLGL
jgi:hypothetical protein